MLITNNKIAMKKPLLLLVALLSFCFASAQLNPFDLIVCSGNPVYFESVTPDVLGGLSPNDYTVTYHLSQADANTGANPIPPVFTAPGNMLVFVRAVENANPSNVLMGTMNVVVHATPVVPDQTFVVCDNDGTNDGFAAVDLGSAAEQIWAATQTDFNSLYLTFHLTQADAQAQVNPINWSGFTNTVPHNQTIWVHAQNATNGCSAISQLTLITTVFCQGGCWQPTGISVGQITPTTAMVFWDTLSSSNSEMIIVPAGAPAPTASTVGTPVSQLPYTVVGLNCSTAYDVYARIICPDTVSAWTGPSTFSTLSCQGAPVNLAQCSETNQACFDLTSNDANVLGWLNPSEYSIAYYPTQADANNGTNAIANPANYCITQSGMASTEVFVRLENIATSDFTVFGFALTVQQVIAGNFTPVAMTQCDENGDGIVIFDLTTVAAQLNTANTLTYYTNSLDATSITGAGALANPQAFSMSATTGVQTMTIFVRENVADGCDIIYSLQLNVSANCNLANSCFSANSLCGSLGVPFSNTVNIGNAEPGIDYDCLMSQPNPTWFFLPISQAGTLDFHISQTASNGMSGIDVDFICWGPFPGLACGPANLNPASQVACSYSASPDEDFTIANAQPGQFYVLMVTNFSNQPGLITISQVNAGTPNSGDIDCTGIRMTAFLDSNANGTKDPGEPNFSLGQFHYEKNNDGNVHHISSPTGNYGIYDMNASNSYDFSFDIDPAYSANYALTTSAYSDIHVVPGAGMAQYYFPVTVTQAYNDLAVTIIPGASPQPGFTYTNTIKYTNLGSQAMASGTVTFNKPPQVSIVSISESGTVGNAAGFTYTFTNLLPFESREMIVTMQVPTMPTVALGDLLTSNAGIEPLAGDVAPENNTSTSAQTIIGSYDPNDKMESHGPRIAIADFTSEDYLYYTIRFENTGTAPALNVRISDILESKLDETSVLMVDASHDYVLDRIGSTLTWNFDNIVLPTTTIDPEGGKGYVMFKVKPKPGYAVGDIIQNTASIYFDFNPAIVTNTFTSEFVPFLGNPSFSTGNFAMYPNPAGDHVTVTLSESAETIAGISVHDMLGKTILVRMPSAAANSETIDVSNISSGMYFLEVTTANNRKSVKKLVIE